MTAKEAARLAAEDDADDEARELMAAVWQPVRDELLREDAWRAALAGTRWTTMQASEPPSGAAVTHLLWVLFPPLTARADL